MTQEQKELILESIQKRFRTFGNGQGSEWNPIVNALADKPLQFAAGVDVEQVIDWVEHCFETFNVEINTNQ